MFSVSQHLACVTRGRVERTVFTAEVEGRQQVGVLTFSINRTGDAMDVINLHKRLGRGRSQ